MYGQTLASTGGGAVILGISAGWWLMAAVGAVLAGLALLALLRRNKKGVMP